MDSMSKVFGEVRGRKKDQRSKSFIKKTEKNIDNLNLLIRMGDLFGKFGKLEYY